MHRCILGSWRSGDLAVQGCGALLETTCGRGTTPCSDASHAQRLSALRGLPWPLEARRSSIGKQHRGTRHEGNATNAQAVDASIQDLPILAPMSRSHALGLQALNMLAHGCKPWGAEWCRLAFDRRTALNVPACFGASRAS